MLCLDQLGKTGRSLRCANIHMLIEQAAAQPGAEGEPRTADRIVEQDAPLNRLFKEREKA